MTGTSVRTKGAVVVEYGYRMQWDSDSEELLKKRWMEGVEAGEIAKEIGGVTKNAVIGKAHRLGLPIHPSRNKQPKPQGISVDRARVSLPKIKLAVPKEVRLMPEQKPSDDPKDWIPFKSLTMETCRAILNDNPREALYCNNKAVVGAYCAYHDRRFHDRSWRPRGRDRDALQRLAALQK